jgi:DNA-directed RNA polymerase specialized sigma24 family protein
MIRGSCNDTVAKRIRRSSTVVAQAGQKLNPALRRYLRNWRLRDPAETQARAAAAIKPLPERVSRVSDRLTDEQQQAIIASFQAGTSKQTLAERYGTSISSVKRLLREHGVRGERWPEHPV